MNQLFECFRNESECLVFRLSRMKCTDVGIGPKNLNDWIDVALVEHYPSPQRVRLKACTYTGRN